MKKNTVQPDKSTFDQTLMACSKLGNLKKAYEVVLDMKNLKI